ncbi:MULTISPECIES: iron ABC transporter permease [unclassified Enterococcus]|uniref:FecCD family ABC transporter permease n=1 Tax=unclassified Enterococcus TaxID=2608891 RepID=UPI002474BD9E|nr:MULTISPECIES: iron ABC transporter permease [unclassified Enterococcus]
MKVKKTPLIMVGLLLLCLLVFYLSLTNGAVMVERKTIYQALFHFDKNNQSQQIIRNLRLPRILASFLVGSCFAVSGALMQGITRNPLAESGLLGINSGAAFGLALCFILFPKASTSSTLLFSFGSALLVTLIIFLITNISSSSFSAVQLVLAGVAISSLFSAISQAMALFFNLQQDLAFWYIGGVANVTWQQFWQVLPIFIFGSLASLFLGNQINCLVLGDETAISLGKNPVLIRGIAVVLTVLLAGIAVALVGPISFVGLMVPHTIRHFTDENYRLILPFSIVLGGLLVMLADFCARLLNPPFETPFGILISLIGVPFLLYKVRSSDE